MKESKRQLFETLTNILLHQVISSSVTTTFIKLMRSNAQQLKKWENKLVFMHDIWYVLPEHHTCIILLQHIFQPGLNVVFHNYNSNI